MGLFDSVVILDPELRAQVKCAQGHVQPEDEYYQTKDLNCLMDDLTLLDGRLYRREGPWDDDSDVQGAFAPAEPVSYTGQIRFYSDCDLCPTTYWILPDHPSRFGPQAAKPWIEYIALIHRGRVIALEPALLETLEDVRNHMASWIETDSKGVRLT